MVLVEDKPRENAIKDYVEYLNRRARTSSKTQWELHQELLSREVARSYGLTEKQIAQLDEDL